MPLLFVFVVVTLFMLGTAIGSFLNVVIYRTVHEEKWTSGRSKCEHCGKALLWFDMVPLFSYFFLGGKCRFCHTPLSLSHPVIELITGLLFVWWLVMGSLFFRITAHPFTMIQPLFWLTVGLCLVVIFFADIRYMIIPDEPVYLLTAITLFYRIGLTLGGVMQPIDFVKTVVGCVLVWGFFYSIWLLTKGTGMGFGDVKFTIPFGLLLGWPNVFVGTFLAFCFGAVVGVLLLALKKKSFRQAIPFGPFLVVSTLVTLVYGTHLWQWYIHLL